MIRKALIGTMAGLVLGTFFFGRDVFSYARTWGSSIRDAVKAEVPLEFEVERAHEMVENLVPDIRNCLYVIAEQQVDIENLDDEIARKAANMDEQKEAILALRTDLKSGDTTFVYARRSYSSDEVQRDLAHRFERYKAAEEMLHRQRQILQARQKTMLANQEKLEKLLVAKQDLAVQVAQLEARLKTVQAAETVSTLEIDDSQLSRVKKLIRELNRQIDIKVKVLDAEGQFTDLIPVDAKPASTADVTREIDAYFGPASTKTDLAEVDRAALEG